MKAKHRKLLRELMDYCNMLGGELDGTSTNEAKYRDRQRSNMLSYNVLYAVLADHPENDSSDHDFEIAEKSLEQMKELTTKKYPDRKGEY